MASSLIPERPLLISPTLAATIGLEEAVMLHVLSEIMQHLPASPDDNLRWLETDYASLTAAMPFWSGDDIKRIQQNLLEKGLVQIDGGGKTDRFRLAINQSGRMKPVEHKAPTSASEKPANVYDRPSPGKATHIPDDWRPDEDLYQLCAQRNIPRDFIDEQVRLFVISQQERRRAQYSWHNVFFKYIVREWEQKRSHQGLKELEAPMSPEWQPSGDAYNILENAGINHSFIEDAVPEFVLYWRETGIRNSTWNTRFIAHVRRQWAKFEAALEHDAVPKLVPEDYTPSEEVYEILGMANIDEAFARSLIPEFILYWRERKEVTPSWHTKFLQHVKYKWAHRQDNKEDFVERVTDRSWAN